MRRTGHAIATTSALAASLGLGAHDAVVLQNSNKLTLRLLPGQVLARVAPLAEPGAVQIARFELDVAAHLAASGAPVALPAPGIEPRVHERDGYAVTFWTYHEPVARPLTPAEYAHALRDLHTGMRGIDLPAPHFTDRVAVALDRLADHARTPDLATADRELLAGALRDGSRAVAESAVPEQFLHGEPHPGNLVTTRDRPLFVDFETCCRGPVEYDLAHTPDDVAAHYPGADPRVLNDCRVVMTAMIATWRWDRDDELPGRDRLRHEWLSRLRRAI
ncbi:aminoglycoside phosphotransferase family protein [Kineosporia sp. J2-2]|uniref:Aminoglycoside phosphotransferase family protein n=1 Tax=Kineosporia corallincola TaxID=2835133 RepID=A0ABS5TFU5_9ACTN|nr:aminoglycoside phosphotransferase family protein [Kineosporia corallincola]MBT0769922.1 aminoglycoside phosphotransferase family protein [Kineosporia corallincola]